MWACFTAKLVGLVGAGAAAHTHTCTGEQKEEISGSSSGIPPNEQGFFGFYTQVPSFAICVIARTISQTEKDRLYSKYECMYEVLLRVGLTVHGAINAREVGVAMCHTEYFCLISLYKRDIGKDY